MPGSMRYATSPATPLGPHLTPKNRVLVGGPCKALTPTPWRALLWCDFTARSEAIGCSCAHFPPLQVGPFSRRFAEAVGKFFIENGSSQVSGIYKKM